MPAPVESWTSPYDVPNAMAEAFQATVLRQFNEGVSIYAAKFGLFAALRSLPSHLQES